MSVNSYDELKFHVGHDIECVSYGGVLNANVAVECVTCGTVLLDFDHPDNTEPEVYIDRHD